jgi:hypothetical protein
VRTVISTVLTLGILAVAGCSPASETTTTLSLDTTTSSLLGTLFPPPEFQTTTTVATCATEVDLVFRDWSIAGEPTHAVEAWPFLGYQSAFFRVEDSTAERGVRFFLRADEGFDAGGSAALEAAMAKFTRGQSLPQQAVFSGYSTEWVELWWDPENLDAVYVVPRTESRFTETEKWPAIPFGGHCA